MIIEIEDFVIVSPPLAPPDALSRRLHVLYSRL